VSPARESERYVPAAGRRLFSGVYDPVVALTMRERAFRGAVLDAVLAPPVPSTVIDIGCGTGSLAIALARRAPQLRIVGVDGDLDMLARAEAKLAQSGPGARVDWVQGRAERLPCEHASADVAALTLVLHHLAPVGKEAALSEAQRVLRPGGRLVVADWGRPRDPLTSLGFLALQLIDGFAITGEHRAGRLAQRIEQAGFDAPRVLERWRTIWGSLELIVATRRVVE
jgi:ubiquinone/menaquinone biosynthesis C-methylase UbiE